MNRKQELIEQYVEVVDALWAKGWLFEAEEIYRQSAKEKSKQRRGAKNQ